MLGVSLHVSWLQRCRHMPACPAVAAWAVMCRCSLHTQICWRACSCLHAYICCMPAPAGGLTGGGGSGPSHLIPLQQAAGGSQFDPGLVCAMHPLHPPASAPGGAGQQFAPDAASALFLPVRLGGVV